MLEYGDGLWPTIGLYHSQTRSRAEVLPQQNVLSPKELCVRPTTSVRVSAERSRLTPASVTSRQSSAN